MCLARHCFGQQSLTCSGRSDEQGSLRKLRADLGVLGRIVQEVNALLQALLGLIFTGDIAECDSCILLNVCLGLTLADAHHSAAAPHAVHEHTDDDHEQDEGDQEG